MSAATADAAAADAPPKGGAGKKKLIIVIAAVLLLVLAGGGAALMLMKKKPADADGEEGDGHAPAAAAAHPKKDVKHDAPPVFVPLDPFTVNLADKEAERYAQVGITFQIDESKTGDLLKAYMPAIRNNILLLLSHKTAAELLSLEGKLKLAKDIQRESLRPLGIEMEAPDEEAADEDKPKKKKAKKKAAEPTYPITAVHFSNIIIQ